MGRGGAPGLPSGPCREKLTCARGCWVETRRQRRLHGALASWASGRTPRRSNTPSWPHRTAGQCRPAPTTGPPRPPAQHNHSATILHPSQSVSRLQRFAPQHGVLPSYIRPCSQHPAPFQPKPTPPSRRPAICNRTWHRNCNWQRTWPASGDMSGCGRSGPSVTIAKALRDTARGAPSAATLAVPGCRRSSCSNSEKCAMRSSSGASELGEGAVTGWRGRRAEGGHGWLGGRDGVGERVVSRRISACACACGHTHPHPPGTSTKIQVWKRSAPSAARSYTGCWAGAEAGRARKLKRRHVATRTQAPHRLASLTGATAITNTSLLTATPTTPPRLSHCNPSPAPFCLPQRPAAPSPLSRPWGCARSRPRRCGRGPSRWRPACWAAAGWGS